MRLRILEPRMSDITADTSDYGLMKYFVGQTVERMQTGHDPKMTAMFAFHFAGTIRDQPTAPCPTCDGYLVDNHYCPGLHRDE